MTTTELLALIGKHTGGSDTALINLDGLYVPVKVLDAKYVFGRTDVLVTPIGGHGQKWTRVEKLVPIKK